MPVELSHLAGLSEEDRQAMATWLEDFQRTWSDDRLAMVVRLLPPPGNSLRNPLLLELVKIDLKRQWQRGFCVGIESYLSDYPELGNAETAPADLVHVEFETRQQCGDADFEEDLARRFPRQIEEIRNHEMTGEVNFSQAATREKTLIVSKPPPMSATATHGNAGPVVLSGTFGRYEIVKPIGQGGMGAVYLARDSQLQRLVALKVPHFNQHNAPRILERFRREARAAATLVHPNLCPVHDVGQCNGLHYLTMAFIEGKPLSSYVHGGRQVPQRQAAVWVQLIALALHEAHLKGVVHRDLKPSNIMINQRGEPVVMDFGLARLSNDENVRLTQTGVPLGTPHYMSPEQVEGEEVGPPGDIYSLGVILYELLTGRVPFKGVIGKVLAQILTEEPPPPSRLRADLDLKLEKICLKALSKHAEDRYASMDEFATALARFLGGGTSRSDIIMNQVPSSDATPDADAQARQTLPSTCTALLPPQPRFGRRPKDSRRAMLVVAGLALLLPLLVLVPIVIFSTTGSRTEPKTSVKTENTPKQVDKSSPSSNGTLQLTVSRSDIPFEVEIDGRAYSHEKLSAGITLATGIHRLVLKGDYIDTIEQQIEVKAGTVTSLTRELVYYGYVTLDPKDPDAPVTVTIDDKTVPLDRKPIRLGEGNHQLKMTGDYIDLFSQKLRVMPGVGRDLDLDTTARYGKVQFVLFGDDESLEVKVAEKTLKGASLRETFSLSPGEYVARIEGKDMIPAERKFSVEKGKLNKVQIDPVHAGKLKIEVNVAGAAIEIRTRGGALVEFANQDLPTTLPVDDYRLRVTANRYKPFEKEFRIARGTTKVEKVMLEPVEIVGDGKSFETVLRARMVLLQPGSFKMGSSNKDPEALENEKPRHDVKISRKFFMGAREVTVAEFKAFVKDKKYKTDAETSKKGAFRFDSDQGKMIQSAKCTWQSPGYDQEDDDPVVCVSWNDARAFCEWLSARESRKYRLPTEAEWEYACRAGHETIFTFGETLSPSDANFNAALGLEGVRPANSPGRVARVGKFKANAFGLFDMHGNVAEWCQDRYQKDYYQHVPPIDPPGPDKGELRVMRGGSWLDEAKSCRSAFRGFDDPDFAAFNVGFRIVCESEVEKK